MLARALLVTFVLAGVVNAQEIVIPTTFEEDGSVRDEPRGAPAEEVLALTFISLQDSREWRAFSEHDISGAVGLPLSRAEITGAIAVNNALDTGERTVELSLYAADGAITLDDFDQGTMVLGTVSYAPPGETSVPFSYDILSEVQTLIDAGATQIGLRARSTVNDAPNALTMVELEIATLCGNGVMDDGEECDSGTDNSDTEPDACRRACVNASCGDGVIDTDEGCDDGDANGPDGTCSLTCAVATDAGMPDAGVDAGADAGADTGSELDAASDPDSGAGLDSGSGVDAGMVDPGGDGCGCRAAHTGDAWLALMVLGLLLRRRS